MKLPQEFYRLPLRFDAERLRVEALAFAPDEWRKHPTGYAGNSAIRLISVDGGENDEVSGAMRPTVNLRRCPYVQQVLAHFGVVWGRSRLMKLGPKSVVPEHSDVNYHWFHRVRLHIPVVTYPEVRFHCGDRSVHMAAGEAWLFDNWRTHRVENPTDHERIHLVADTTGSAAFWQMVAASASDGVAAGGGLEPPLVPYVPGKQPELLTERYNTPVVMPPSDVEMLLSDLSNDLAVTEDTADSRRAAVEFRRLLEGFVQEWRRLWSLFGDSREGWPQYLGLRDYLWQQVEPLSTSVVTWSNRVPARVVLHARVLSHAVSIPGAATAAEGEYTAQPSSGNPRPRVSAPDARKVFDRPVFIVAAPRSGSTLLFETLSCSRNLWTVGGETHTLIERIVELRPGAPGVNSNRLLAQHATDETARHILHGLVSELRNSVGEPYSAGLVRFLEKTPKNALRIPFFNTIFPDARFVFLWRDPRENISSIMEAWRSGGWITYPSLPDWDGPWSLLLPPGWRQLRGKPLEEIAAFQWDCTNRIILDDLAQLDPARWTALAYDDFMRVPAAAVSRICVFADIPYDPVLQSRTAGSLPLSRYTQSPPDRDKWRKNEAAIQKVLPNVSETLKRLRAQSFFPGRQ